VKATDDPEGEIREKFDGYDQDGDGYITVDELRSAITVMGKHYVSLMHLVILVGFLLRHAP
jgi:Ca2+-binding EF-hand superfamily protein